MQEESYGLKKIVVRALRENTLIERVAVVISRGAGRGAAQALEPCFGCAHAHGSTGGPLCVLPPVERSGGGLLTYGVERKGEVADLLYSCKLGRRMTPEAALPVRFRKGLPDMGF